MSDPADRPDFTWEEFNRAAESEAPREENRFQPCYRHPDASTGITCQRCGRHICGACMVPASVGFHCPECRGGDAKRSRHGTSRSGPPVTVPFAETGIWQGATPYLALTIGIVGLLDLILRGLPSILLGWAADPIASGQVWRLLTSGLVTAGLFNTIITTLFIFWVGRTAEAQMGAGRFLALFGLSTLGSSLALSIVQPVPMWYASFSAVLGLLAAMAVLKHRVGQDIRGDLILLGLMVALNVVLGFNGGGAASHIGAIALGALGGYIVGYVGEPRAQWTWLGLAGAVALAGGVAAAVLI